MQYLRNIAIKILINISSEIFYISIVKVISWFSFPHGSMGTRNLKVTPKTPKP